MTAREFWIAVGAGLVGSVIFGVLIQPVMSLVGAALLALPDVVSDHIYSRAAIQLLMPFDVNAMTQTAILMMLLALSELHALDSRPKPGPPHTYVLSIVRVATISVLLVLFVSWTIDLTAYRLTIRFERRLTTLLPHVSSGEIAETRSLWVNMTTAQEYAALNDRMDAAAAAANATLPPRR